MSILTRLREALGAEKQAPKGSAVVRQTFVAQAPDRNAAEFLKAYSQNEWLYAAVTVIAEKMAEQNIRLYRYTGTGKNRTKEEVFEHPALSILNDPNPLQGKIDLISHIVAQNEMLGNAYLLLVKGDRTGRPMELWPLNPRFVSIKWKTDGTIDYYQYRLDAATHRLDPEEVLHFKLPNPQSMYFGVAPAQAAAFSIDTDIFSLKWWRNFFFNSARPDFLLLFKKIAKEARERLERKFNEKFRGVDNSHKMAVLEQTEGLEIHEFSKPDDSQLASGADHRRDRILASYRVPRDLIGLGQNSNLASIQGSIFIFAVFTLKPKLARFAEQLNREFLSLFPNSDNLAFEYDDPTPENVEEKNKLAESGLANGYLTINEARQLQGYAPIDSGDTVLVPFQRVPLESVVGGSTEPKQIAAPKQKAKLPGRDILKAQHLERHKRLENRFIELMEIFFARQEREVLADLRDGGLKSVKELDPMSPLEAQKWINELVLAAVPLYELTVETGGTEAAALVSADAVFNFSTPAVRAFIADMTFRFSTQVNETTQSQLRKELIEAQAEGEGIDDITDRVRGVFTEAKQNRSRLIARTETTKAFNGGAAESYKQLGIAQFEWLATEDERTRATHAAADGQVQPAGTPFTVGDSKLLFPGDPAGPVEEVANCRCTLLPVVE